jgi:hypothetical protein
LSTPLHDPDVLVNLAEGPAGTARDWANLRLALVDPTEVRDLPTDPYDAALVMVAGAPEAAEAVFAGLKGRETTREAATRAEQLSAFGLVPEDSESWVPALREALAGDGRESDLYLVQLLADLGAMDGAALGAAAKVDSPDAVVALPALVVRYAASQGNADAAAQAVVARLKDAKITKSLPGNVLALLGVPHLLWKGADERSVAVEIGQMMAGEELDVRAAKGSARRRSQKWVSQLLDGMAGAAASMVRGMSSEELGEPLQLVAAAAWLAARNPSLSALDAVLDQHAGEDRILLSAARRAVGGADEPRIRSALANPGLELCPPSVLVADRTASSMDVSWLDALLERYVRHPNVDLRSDLVTTLVFGRAPDRVAQLLADSSTRWPRRKRCSRPCSTCRCPATGTCASSMCRPSRRWGTQRRWPRWTRSGRPTGVLRCVTRGRRRTPFSARRSAAATSRRCHARSAPSRSSYARTVGPRDGRWCRPARSCRPRSAAR